MKRKVTRKRVTTTQAVAASSNDELIALFKEKASTNDEGWTMGAVVADTLSRLNKGDRVTRVLQKQGFGRPPGHYGVARRVVQRLAPSCATFDELLAAMQREKGADREVIDIDDAEVTFYDRGRSKSVAYATLRRYLRQAKRDT